MELNKHAEFFLDEKARILFNHRSSITHHKKSYGNEKFIKTTKFRENPWYQRHNIQKLSTKAIKNANLCLDVMPRMFVIQKLLIRPYNMSLTMKATSNTGKIQKLI